MGPERKIMPSFVRIQTDSGLVLPNLSQVLEVDEISTGHCRVNLGHALIYEIVGPGADKLVQAIVKDAELAIEAQVKFQELSLPEPVDPPGARIPRMP